MFAAVKEFCCIVSYVRGYLGGTAVLARGLQDSEKAFILFFLLISDSNTNSFSSVNHPTLTIQLYNLYKHRRGTLVINQN